MRLDRFLPCLHILGVSAIAVAQPLLDLLGRNPEFFLAHRAGPVEILLLVAGVVLLLPLLLCALARVGGRVVHRLVLAVLVSLLGMQLARQLGVQTWTVAAPLAGCAAVATVAAYHRVKAIRTFATLLALSAIVVPAIFLVRPTIWRLIDPPDTTAPVAHAKAGAGSLPPLLMIVMDETPLISLLDADRKIDPVLYPNLARLTRSGIWFRNATTVSDYTPFAVPAILSGRYPRPGSTPSRADHPETLFTLLAQTHRLELVEAITRLSPFEPSERDQEPVAARVAALARDVLVVYQHVLLTEDLTAGLPQLTDDWANFDEGDVERTAPARRPVRRRGRNRLETVLNFADWIEPQDPQPTFYYIHTLLSHSPWVWLPSGKRNGTRTSFTGDDVKRWWSNDEWGLKQYYQRHLLQIGLVDRAIGRVMAKLEAAGLYDRALIVVTSDHGIVFRPRLHRRSFAEESAAEIMRVPLIIKFPKGTPMPAGPITKVDGQNVDDRNAETIDIVPTVVDALGLEMTWRVDGVSLLDAGSGRASKRMLFDAARRSRFYAPDGPDAGAAVRRKLEIFGGSDNLYRVPRPGRFEELVGRRLSDMRILGGGGGVGVELLPAFAAVSTTGDAVPFDVAGWFVQPRSKQEPTFVAVAINGTIRAVTRTWSGAPRRWIATAPPEAWHDGHNQIDVFVVGADERGAYLRRTRTSEWRGSPN